MDEILAKLPTWVKLIPTIFLGLVLMATVVVRFTKTESDDKVVGKIKGYVISLLHRFPTLGLNPYTKKLQAALVALKKDDNPAVQAAADKVTADVKVTSDNS